jgi:hypothetical protein
MREYAFHVVLSLQQASFELLARDYNGGGILGK